MADLYVTVDISMHIDEYIIECLDVAGKLLKLREAPRFKYKSKSCRI
jgi:hypothetical protein